MKKYLINYVIENSKMLKIFLICILIGIVSGIVMYGFSSDNTKEELKGVVVNTLNISKQENFEGINVIKNGITTNLILIALIYFSIITMISPVIISLLNVTKGISIGIYIPIIFSIFGVSKGMLVLLLLVLIPNLFYIPAYVFLSTNALNLHFAIVNKSENKASLLVKQIAFIVIAFSFVFLSIVIEQILSLNVIDIYKGLG